MIVQSAPDGATRFVIRMTEHTAFAGKMARAFGNDRFEPLSPREEMLFVVEHHDQGWVSFDADPAIDPETGLPYHLTNTPREVAIETGDRSADFNEAHHPYCGLLSSMHIWGLYYGRYGLSEKKLISLVPPAWQPSYRTMLDRHLSRQDRLRDALARAPETAAWIEEDHLFQNYKQLQFFDTLGLYFHCTHDDARGEAAFPGVPLSEREDATVTVRRVDAGVYAFDPFPWREDGETLTFEGRYMAPADDPESADGAALMRETPVSEQAVTFVSAPA